MACIPDHLCLRQRGERGGGDECRCRSHKAFSTKPTRVRSPALDVWHVCHVLKANAAVIEQSPESYSQFVSAAQLVASFLPSHAKTCVVKARDVESAANITDAINDSSATHSESEALHVQSPVHAALVLIAAHVKVS